MEPPTHIYLISGLGADERAFMHLQIDMYPHTHIQWVVPEPKETINDYALRLCKQIIHPQPILIGLSFGGMIAIEIAKQTDVKGVILLSSAKNKNELPFLYRISGKLGLHKLLPYKQMKQGNSIMFFLFGVTDTQDKILLSEILKDTDLYFLKWAINAIVSWKNTIVPKHLIHIHGTRDFIIPIHNLQSNYKIKDGGHLMVLNRASEVSAIITSIIKQLSDAT